MESNTSLSIDTNDPLFHVCWRRQSCGYCLRGDVGCSWCAVTSTCVPNPARIPILAPFSSSQICPLGSKERWELRAMPFGCNVSTITFMTAVVSVLSTLAAVAIGFFLVWAGRRVAGWSGVNRKLRWYPGWAGWGRGGRRRVLVVGDEDGDGIVDGERRPLLGGA